ncbi:hypothetical protein [Rhizocola hellebori]|uniref:hypothetical protein n=1 Tax=Rhizocola hellebori TaxID=1392758 RepID=UPI001EF20BF9|nr:hypothetical protein [Rhizocola hellebori]
MTSSTSNVYRDGAGHLVIKPLRDGGGNWTSGRIETQRTDFAWKPSTVAARISRPSTVESRPAARATSSPASAAASGPAVAA